MVESKVFHIDVILGVASIANAHTYGNVMSYVREVLENYFEPNFFTEIHMSSQAYFRNRKRRRLNPAIPKRPDGIYMYIKPVFETPDDDLFLNNTFMTSNFDNVESGISRKSLQPMIKDDNSQYEMRFKLNRDRISFDVTINLRTQTEQIDLYKRMKNTIRWIHPYTQRTSLEALIPKTMIKQIASIKNLDIESETNISIMLSYLQSVSGYPITYKIRNATSQDEFFMYYTTKILLSFTDLNKSDGNWHNMVEDDFQITFRITADFNLPGAFYIMGDDRHPSHMSLAISIDESGKDADNEIIPLFTVDKLYDDVLSMYDGYRLYATAIIQTEKNLKNKDDVFNLDSLFTNDVRQIIVNHNTMSIPVHLLFRPRLYKNTKSLKENEDYILDWNKMVIIIHDTDPTVTYRLILYANMGYLNEKLENFMSFNKDKTYENINSKPEKKPFDNRGNLAFTTKDHQYL